MTFAETVGIIIIAFFAGMSVGLYFELITLTRLKKENERLRKQRQKGYEPIPVELGLKHVRK